MATPRKKPEDRLPMGAPTEYRPEYCKALVDHMRQGNNFKSFGSIVGRCEKTLYNWTEQHPDFLQAKKDGEVHLEKFYTDMGKMIATGQLRRVKSERPVIGSDNKPVYDANGNLVMEREYEPTTGNSTAWIFLCKNMLKWRDRSDVNIAGQPDNQTPIRVESTALTKEEMKKRLGDLLKKAKEEE